MDLMDSESIRCQRRGGQEVAGDRGRGGYVQRIHSPAHRDPDAEIGVGTPARRQAIALGAEQQGQAAVGRHLADRHRVIGEDQGEQPEPRGAQAAEAGPPVRHPGIGDGGERR